MFSGQYEITFSAWKRIFEQKAHGNTSLNKGNRETPQRKRSFLLKKTEEGEMRNPPKKAKWCLFHFTMKKRTKYFKA